MRSKSSESSARSRRARGCRRSRWRFIHACSRLLAGSGGTRLEELEAVARRRFFLVPTSSNGHVHLDHFDVIGQGKLDVLRPAAPVAEGAEIELKLVEVGLYDPAAGVGKLDGDYEVVVAGASKLVGKKVKARIGRALEGVAYATLPESEVVAASPITFEAEAEKPMRASRSKKDTDAAPELEASIETTIGEDEPVLEDELVLEDEPVVGEEQVDGDGRRSAEEEANAPRNARWPWSQEACRDRGIRKRRRDTRRPGKRSTRTADPRASVRSGSGRGGGGGRLPSRWRPTCPMTRRQRWR